DPRRRDRLRPRPRPGRESDQFFLPAYRRTAFHPMKFLTSHLLLAAFLAAAPDTKPEQNTAALDATTLANLRSEFASAEPRAFEETAFALGRIESRPGATTAMSSRISGRVVDLAATLGESVEADAEIVRVESRQAGNPPPVVALRAPQAGVVTALNV